jgi:glycosyltransferase involved in cell wall biosynthesis
MKVTCLVKRWGHHTASGGYDHLAAAVGAKVVKRQTVASFPARIAQKVWLRSTSTHDYLLDYQFGDWLAEFRVLASSLMSPPDVVHVLYGDDQLDQLLRLRRLLRCPLVASFHLPPDRASVSRRFESLQTYAAQRIDAAIVLATSQVQQYENWLGQGKVVYVPHGIDTERFRPGERFSHDDNVRLLLVGQHMRDWQVTHSVIDAVNTLELPVRFDVVTRERDFAYFTGCRNTSLRCGLSEAVLIELYRSADAVLLPVTDSTANNSVLESLACGTPVISTSVGGIPDYVNKKSGWLFAKGDTRSIVNLVEAMCANRELANSRRAGARNQALNFSWPRIAERMLAIYSAVKSGRRLSEAARLDDRTSSD